MWENEDYPTWFKARALAFYNLRNFVEAVKNDVAQKASNKR